MYLSANVFTLFEPITAKWRLFRGVPLFDALVRGEPLHPVARNFVTINQRPWGSPQWRFRDPSLHRFDTAHECDRQTDRWTDRQTPRRWQRRTKHSAFTRKKGDNSYAHLLSSYCTLVADANFCQSRIFLHETFTVGFTIVCCHILDASQSESDLH